MRNLFIWIILVFMAVIILLFLLGYQKAGFAAGFGFITLLTAAGTFYSGKNSEYVHKSYHEDYVNRRRKR